MDASANARVTPERPSTVVGGAILLLATAVALLIGWVVQPAAVVSNGGQVFFIMLWSVFAHAAYTGLGWVRLAIAALFAAAIWGAINSDAGMSLGFVDALTLVLEIAGFVLLCLPASNQWYAEIAALRKDEDD